MNKSAKISAGIIFLGVAVVAVIMATRDGGTNQTSVDTSGEARPVTIIKYNDYQCPSCKVVKPWEEQLQSEFGEMITIEYRHFPLSMHPNAVPAAKAVEAARLQGYFEEMHNRIFEEQTSWSAVVDPQPVFVGYAEDLGLDTTQFLEDMQSEEIQSVIDRDVSEGNRRLVTGTPTYFINGQKISSQASPRSYAQFKTLVEMFMYR